MHAEDHDTGPGLFSPKRSPTLSLLVGADPDAVLDTMSVALHFSVFFGLALSTLY